MQRSLDQILEEQDRTLAKALDTVDELVRDSLEVADELSTSDEIGAVQDSARRVESPRRRYQRIGRAREALKQIELPEPGTELVVIMTGKWHGWDMIEALITLARPATIQRLEMATLGSNKTHAARIGELIDRGDIRHAHMLVGEMFREKSPAVYETLRHQLESRGSTIAANRNHAKLAIFYLDAGPPIVVHGSLNMSRCASFEQLAISRDPDLADFFSAYISDASIHAITA